MTREEIENHRLWAQREGKTFREMAQKYELLSLRAPKELDPDLFAYYRLVSREFSDLASLRTPPPDHERCRPSESLPEFDTGHEWSGR